MENVDDADVFPVSAKIEVCGKCTLDCQFCFNRFMKQHDIRQKIMTAEQFLKVRKFIKTIPTLREVGLFYMGESGLNDNLPRFYEMMKEDGYFTFLTTNGTISDNIMRSIPFVDSLKVSWNYSDKIDFVSKTGSVESMYDRIIENISRFYDECHRNGKPLAISTVLDTTMDRYSQALSNLKYDEHYWIPLQTQCGTISNGIGGVVGQYENMRDQIPCWSLFKFLYVDVDLNVRSCCYGHNDCHILYNIQDKQEYSVCDSLRMMRNCHLNDTIPSQCQMCVNCK